MLCINLRKCFKQLASGQASLVSTCPSHISPGQLEVMREF